MVNAELIVFIQAVLSIVLMAAGAIATAYEVYTGSIRRRWRQLDQIGEVEESVDELCGDVDDLKRGVIAVAMAQERDADIDIGELRETLNGGDYPTDLLGGHPWEAGDD